MAPKAVDDTAKIVPMPAIAAPDSVNIPTAAPSELKTVRRHPTATEFDTASRTPGPGVKVTSKATPQNSSQFESCTIKPCSEAAPASFAVREMIFSCFESALTYAMPQNSYPYEPRR